MTRHIKRGGKVWINVFPDKPVTEKPAETRMGSGKGNPERWVAVVKPGRIMFELSLPRRRVVAKEAIERAIQKLPIKATLRHPRRRRSDGRRHDELRELDDDELVDAARPRRRQELFNLRFQHVTGQLDNYAAPRRSCAGTSPASTPSCAAREIAAAEALQPRRTPDG